MPLQNQITTNEHQTKKLTFQDANHTLSIFQIDAFFVLTTFLLMIISFFVCYGLFSFVKDAHRVFYKMINDITKKFIKYCDNR